MEQKRAAFFVDRMLAAAAAGSGALLLGAHLFEWFAGLAPCALCLDQRQAHWAALGVAIFGLAASMLFRARLAAAAAVGAASLVFSMSAALAFYHAGVEHKFWPGPKTCSGAAGPVRAADILESLANKPAGPACEDVAWSLFGVSMAGYNLLFSAGLAAATFAAAVAAAREARLARRPIIAPQSRGEAT